MDALGDGSARRIPVGVPAVKAVLALGEEEAGSTSLTTGGRLSTGALHGERTFMLFARFIVTDATCRPEDILGSLEVDSDGSFVGNNGNYQPSGILLLS